MEPGVQIIPGTGHVLVRGPLIVVFPANTAAAQDANVLVNQLHASGRWDFDSVAATLQDLVVAHDLMGLAALNLWGADHILFLFDGAEASTAAGTVASNGRESWVTEVVGGDAIELRLTGTSSMPPAHGTELRDGIVEGAGARLLLAEASAPRSTSVGSTGTTPPTMQPGGAPPTPPPGGAPPTPPPGGAPPIPPPGTVPPPPPRSSGLGRPTRVPPPAPPPPTPEQPRQS